MTTTTDFTRKTINDLTNEPGKDAYLWDQTTPGFGVKLSAGGLRTYIYQYRFHGKSRRITIGRVEQITLTAARNKLREVIAGLHGGTDPLAEKQAHRDALTVSQLADLYLTSETFKEKAESTQVADRGRIEHHIKPLLGRAIAASVTKDAVTKMRNDITTGKTARTIATGKKRGVAKVKGGEGAARQAVIILSAIYKWAESEGNLTCENPCKNVKVAPIGQRDVCLEPAQYVALFDLLDNTPMRTDLANAVRFIALTGCRRGEATKLCWRHVELEHGRVVLPPNEHKTGKKTGKPRIIALPSPVIEMLSGLPKGQPDEHVFKSSTGDGALELSRAWRKIAKAAELPENVTLHGLRHSLASMMAMDGQGQAQIAQVLGHRQTSTTERYVHFAEKARSALANAAAAPIMNAISEAKRAA
jgi:integrase